jgi:hypothetical protein
MKSSLSRRIVSFAAPVLRQANKLAGRYGLELTKDDLRDAWRRHMNSLEGVVQPEEGAKAGLPERFRGTFYDEPHSFKPPMQEEAFDWLDRWL